MNPWEVLSIEYTVDLRAIKRAYAIKLKQHKPDVDPEGYQRVRDAFDHAKRIVRSDASRQVEQDPIPNSDATTDEDTLNHSIDVGLTREAEPDSSTEISQVEQPRRETIYINEAVEADEDEPDQVNDELTDVVPELINSIHDILLEQGEVAAFNAFLQCLDKAELIPVDASKQFELYLMDYLNYWAEKQYHDEKFQLPVGMIRQIVKHYSWHKQSSNQGNQFAYLENIYGTTIGNSGEVYLQKLANGTISASHDHRNAAKVLLGKYKPRLFALRAISSSRRKAIYELLTNISNLKDGSFLFELNTDTVHWWINSQSRFLLSGGMVLGGFFAALPLYIYSMETLLDAPAKANFIWPLLPMVLFVGSLVSSIYFTYKICYYGSIVANWVQIHLDSLSALSKEYLSAALSLGLVLAHYFVDKVSDHLSAFIIVIMLLFFIGVYRIRTFILIFELILMIISYDVIHGKLGLEELTMTQILLPIVAINSLVFMAYLAWVKYRTGIDQPTPGQGKTLLINSPALLLICIYSALIN